MNNTQIIKNFEKLLSNCILTNATYIMCFFNNKNKLIACQGIKNINELHFNINNSFTENFSIFEKTDNNIKNWKIHTFTDVKKILQ